MPTEIRKTKLVAVIAALLTTVSPYTANAASQAECSIWLCLPGGFPAGCGAAYSAMISRVKHFKPPLPAFSSCAVNPPPGSGSHMTFDYGPAALIGEQRTCTGWSMWGGDGGDQCTQWTNVPAHYIKGTICQHNDNGSEPPGCVATKMYGDVFIEGTPAGPTFYW